MEEAPAKNLLRVQLFNRRIVKDVLEDFVVTVANLTSRTTQNHAYKLGYLLTKLRATILPLFYFPYNFQLLVGQPLIITLQA